LETEKAAREKAENILEKKALDLYYINLELKDSNENLKKVVEEKTVQLEGVFESILDAYILMDLYGNVLKMNPSAISFFGFDTKKEKFNVVDIIYEEDIEYAMTSFHQLIEKGTFRNYQSRIYTKSKEVKWVQINSSIVYDADGLAVFAQGIVRDITQEKINQEIFNEQKRELSVIVDNSTFGIVLTKQGKIIKTNKAIQKALCYSEEELNQLEVKDVSLPEDKERSYEYMQKLNSGEIDRFSINKRYKTKNGKIIWARTSVAGVRDEKGKVKYQVALIEDLTEELKQGALLEALNSLMASILGKTSIHEIAWEITKNTIGLLGFEDCVIYLFNKETNSLNQIAAFGNLKSSNGTVIDQIEIPLGQGIVGTVAETGVPEIIEDTSKDDRYIVDDMIRYSEISVPIIAEGEIIGVIDSEHSSKNFFTNDHLKTLQTIASLAATQLKNALSLELKQKAEKEKEQVLKDLRKSNTELNDFAHVVSHDLKSPLRSMNALISWMQEDYSEFLKEVEDTHFEMLIKKIDKMDHLINGILKYASVDKIQKQVKNIHLNTIVKDILETIFIPSHIRIEVKKELPIVKGDKFRLQQLFQNLLSNAIKYIDKDQGLVVVDCVSDGVYWKFSVQDNGIGIDEKYFKKIFKVFQVLEEGENSTGVGLSIVKKIIDLYKGEIWLESSEKIGTTFYFTLLK
ncbi:MAG: PAS domain S-box protein, partial [Flavobacteriaceae bacterium]|nr:PAS domain S-box protein [Flavobacteriaceae bacterium]